MTDRYKDYNMYLCKHGHIRYAREFHDPDMCNICGAIDFTYIPEDKREVTLEKIINLSPLKSVTIKEP